MTAQLNAIEVEREVRSRMNNGDADAFLRWEMGKGRQGQCLFHLIAFPAHRRHMKGKKGELHGGGGGETLLSPSDSAFLRRLASHSYAPFFSYLFLPGGFPQHMVNRLTSGDNE